MGFTPTVKAQMMPHVLAFSHLIYENPQGSMSNYYRYGTGFDIGGGFGAGHDLFFVSIGKTTYHSHEKNAEGNLTVAPVTLGIRHYMGIPLSMIFIEGKAGIAYETLQNETYTENKFTYGLGVGFKLFRLLELEAEYKGINLPKPFSDQTGALAVKAGISLKF